MEWIKVSDQMPEEGAEVIAYGQKDKNEWVIKICCIECYEKDFKEFLYIDFDIYATLNNVTHWMPLPEAPKD